MRKIAIVFIIGLISIIVVYCFAQWLKPGGSKKVIKDESVLEYVKTIEVYDKNISSLEVYTQNAVLFFNYKLKNMPQKVILDDIYNKNYNFIVENEVIKNIIYSPPSGDYVRSVYIRFTCKEEIYSYEGRKFIYTEHSKIEDNYQRWDVKKDGMIIDAIIQGN
ncbi:hypothetical protein [Desnuesiella massiliensis]|uniref:hypothetical protein n=1 Tax=Desnuesiella massiliensis TaxID=1650662 RepID=UPI0006E300CC|nr:hypothetical protein [Desnuesiella massiliensis]